jgi:hypothetical protein
MNQESILKQFELIEQSVKRARLPFEVGMLQEEVMEVSMYELMKIREQAANMIKEIGFPRFEAVVTNHIHYPELTVEALNVCPFCGNPHCQSDHK